MKIAMIDLETTGLDPKFHEIIEIGCVVFDSDTFEILDTLDIKAKPQHIERAHPKALEVNGYTEDAWDDAMLLGDALGKLEDIAEGAVFCSFPVAFDFLFIDSVGISGIFNRYKICLFSMLYQKTGEIMSLKNACKRFDIEPEPDVHRAINGAMSEYKLFKALSTVEVD
jgi:DNA polymerase III epsilon subunit-like protein